jgi:hypothetical protein
MDRSLVSESEINPHSKKGKIERKGRLALWPVGPTLTQRPYACWTSHYTNLDLPSHKVFYVPICEGHASSIVEDCGALQQLILNLSYAYSLSS